VIPMMLCVVAFGTSFGPWGAFAVSHRSQMSRLTGLLEKNHILNGGIVQPATGEVSFEDRKEISAVLDYVVTTHGTERLEPLFGNKWVEVDTTAGEDVGDADRRVSFAGSDIVKRMMAEMGIEYIPKWHQPGDEDGNFALSLDPDATEFPLENADIMVKFESSRYKFDTATSTRTVFWNHIHQTVAIVASGDTLEVEMKPWARDVIRRLGTVPGNASISSEQARVTASNDKVHAIVYVDNTNGSVGDDGEIDIRYISGMCFVRWLE